MIQSMQVKIGEESHTLKEWAEITGISKFTIKEEYQRKYNKKHKKSHIYICQICGKENTAKQGVTKYCLDCLKNADNYKLQTYYQNRSSKL